MDQVIQYKTFRKKRAIQKKKMAHDAQQQAFTIFLYTQPSIEYEC